ncbi:Phosphoribulokinase/uridine kinase [Penicillium italicum]|uniref:Phosphoribulokinase/uridine kinase n=1 Tax=Penicillium italicum TaxID=40296 RepID=A0A0A2LGX0_PENIT|nr:Phosphoribulokinase/uridine kinase [Penicillium italicum]
MKMRKPVEKAVIIGISGPSSSGKTTLARLLQRVFCGVNLKAKDSRLNTFIIHEDDFYFPDDQIPYTTTASGEKIQDWDTASAIDIPFLSQALHYVRENGTLPPRLRSKEDQNDQTDSGVCDEVVQELRDVVSSRLGGEAAGNGKDVEYPTIAFLEGFLLFAPPEQEQHVLRSVHDAIHLPLFLPAAYELVKARREGRSGYVTVGPAPEPPVQTSAEKGDGGGDGDGKKKKSTGAEIDLEAEDDRPPQNFWVDPPGYVDDVVWPRYVTDHAWLLVAEDGDEEKNGKSQALAEAALVRRIGDGTRARTDVGVEVAPGCGSAGMDVVLRWAVELILGYYLDRT